MNMRQLIVLCESASTVLYHGTTTRALARIKRDGLIAQGSHWTDRQDIATWFARHKAEDSGGKPVVLRAAMNVFMPGQFQPDLNIMDFPIPAHEADHEIRIKGVKNPQNPTWQESLKLFNAIIYSNSLSIDDVGVMP